MSERPRETLARIRVELAELIPEGEAVIFSREGYSVEQVAAMRAALERQQPTNAERFSVFVQNNRTGEQRCVGWSNRSETGAVLQALKVLRSDEGMPLRGARLRDVIADVFPVGETAHYRTLLGRVLEHHSIGGDPAATFLTQLPRVPGVRRAGRPRSGMYERMTVEPAASSSEPGLRGGA